MTHHLSAQAYHWLAMFYNAIEKGMDWPEDLLHAKAVPIQKPDSDPSQPLSYRVLTILPTLYRLWARMRTQHLQPWMNAWAVDEMFAGIPGRGADLAWWDMTLDHELHQLHGRQHAGAVMDIYKCFN